MRWLGLCLALLVLPAVARADKRPPATCEELPCSVIRNCSSTGVGCHPDDRDCMNDARDRNLEVKCEQQCSDGKHLVYCPADAGRADDSRIVWILLSLAVLLAGVGSAVAWLVLRTKKP